jgi:di/tricarboxylate transporter
MANLWMEMQALGSMYAMVASHFVWVFLAAVLIAALLTTYRLDKRIVPYFERRGVWGYGGAIALGVVSPF